MNITKIDQTLKAELKMFDMTTENMQPEKITQDVLLLTARNDHFIPIKMHKKTNKGTKNRKICYG